MSGKGQFLRAERLIWLDSIKGVLIFLVVFGHTIAGGTAGSENVYGITHYLIYSVHMPMFMLISGCLSKGPAGWKKIIRNYLTPYVIFDFMWVLYALVRRSGSIGMLNLFIPTYVYWYILCLALMKFLASSKIRNELILITGIMLTFAAPLVGKDVWLVLSLGRVALLWFVFYIGLKLPFEKLIKIRSHKKESILVLVLCISAEIIFLRVGLADISWATHDYPITFRECLLKYVFMVLTVGCFCGFVALAPQKESFLARWGVIH